MENTSPKKSKKISKSDARVVLEFAITLAQKISQGEVFPKNPLEKTQS